MVKLTNRHHPRDVSLSSLHFSPRQVTPALEGLAETCPSPQPQEDLVLCEPASPDLRAQVPWGAGGSGAWLASGRSTGPCWRLRGWGPAPPTGLSPSVLGALLVFLGTENLNQVIQPPWEAAGQAGWEACGAGWGRPLRHRRDTAETVITARRHSAPRTQLSVDACLPVSWLSLSPGASQHPLPVVRGETAAQGCAGGQKAPRDRRRRSYT